MDATAMTLGQGHEKVIQYISPDPYILCAKNQRFSSNGFGFRGKVFAAADADAAETNWRDKVTPERGDLITTNSKREKMRPIVSFLSYHPN